MRVATVIGVGTSMEEDQANAAFVVAACNSHEALVQALELALQMIVTTSRRSYAADDVDMIRAALAAAKGGNSIMECHVRYCVCIDVAAASAWVEAIGDGDSSPSTRAYVSEWEWLETEREAKESCSLLRAYLTDDDFVPSNWAASIGAQYAEWLCQRRR